MSTQKERTAKHKILLEDIISVCDRPGCPADGKLIEIIELVARLCLWEIEQEELDD